MSYENLLVYRLAVTIYDANEQFYKKFLKEYAHKRLVEQMTHAARSGKQNIVEGVLEKSMESGLKLVGVGRASFGELLEDYKDFIRSHKYNLWDKNDPRVVKIRTFKEDTANVTNLANIASWTNLDLEKPEEYANIMVCLLFKENYLLDRFYKSLEEQFIKEGGFRENLFKKRLDYKKTNLSN
ncbi:four helix bundle protein [candidate division WWE3 bacterium CG08_land_8_20_14_0_20_40_13]|uniref:Four helix bundle protein n=1 Tax=candidate division WWE3 bacterium CG08_land_8_20_14_0_20_40_13 TaxID=1975084 RepID=A0A2H0XD46_UNCKA|nr:MAG: four helix bundle protein [candidate division WWE3 bacterium CG08_land_8_20_14_0_20_40_13]